MLGKGYYCISIFLAFSCEWAKTTIQIHVGYAGMHTFLKTEKIFIFKNIQICVYEQGIYSGVLSPASSDLAKNIVSWSPDDKNMAYR